MQRHERRRFPRVKLITKVTHIEGDFFHYYYSRDLSVGGMFLETREPFPLGTRLLLEFPLPGVTERVELRGEVVRLVSRSEASPAKPAGMGVKFDEPDQETHALLANFISGKINAD